MKTNIVILPLHTHDLSDDDNKNLKSSAEKQEWVTNAEVLESTVRERRITEKAREGGEPGA